MTRTEKQAIINNIQDGVPNTALTVRTALEALIDGAYSYEVREFDVPTAFISENFDATGLGTGDMLGWAICNGNNGTRNRGGKVSIPYDSSNYPTLGATGGNNSITLTKNNIPVLDCTFPVSDGDNGGGAKVYVMANDYDPAGSHIYTNTVNTATTSTAIDVRQQYIVSLFIMKLPE